MNKFIEWWYQDQKGNEYMSMLHCANGDYIVISLIIILCTGVIFQYSDIAYRHFLNSSKYPLTKLSKYFLGITKVFLLCALTGYGYRILSVWVNPYKLLILLLAILNVSTYRFRKANEGLNVFHRIHQLESIFGNQKSKIEAIKDSIVLDFFKGDNPISFIPYKVLKKIDYGVPFDSDGSGIIENIRINPLLEGFIAKSVMKPNSYISPHSHDTVKILKCMKGEFFDSKTNRSYKEGEYLVIEPRDLKDLNKNWHDVKTGDLETELITYILPYK